MMAHMQLMSIPTPDILQNQDDTFVSYVHMDSTEIGNIKNIKQILA